MSSGEHTTLFDNIINLINQIISTPTDTVIPIILGFVFLALIFSNKDIPKLKASIYSFFLICSIFVLTPVAKSYDLNQRVLLIYYVLFFIVTLQQFYNHPSNFIKKLLLGLKKISWIFAILLIIQLYLITAIYSYIYEFKQRRNDLIAEYQEHNIKNPELPMLSENLGPIVFLDDITIDTDSYNNRVFATFYEFDNVKGIV